MFVASCFALEGETYVTKQVKEDEAVSEFIKKAKLIAPSISLEVFPLLFLFSLQN